MRTKGFNGVLLSTLMIVALMAPAIVTISLLSVSPVSAHPAYENIVRAGANAFAQDINPPPPWVKYVAGDNPPLMVADRIGSGAVVASGFCHTLRNGRWNDLDLDESWRHFDNLLAIAFEWMVPGGKRVWWFEGYDVYNTMILCENLVNSLQDNYGFTITKPVSPRPITRPKLDDYDILVLPQLEVGGPATGGDPDAISDNDVDNVVAWVNDGGGVFMADGADTFGHNYCMNLNKFLKALDPTLEIPFIQSDELRDPENSWSGQEWEMKVEVNNTTWIGSAYENTWGTNVVGVYMPCTLAKRDNYEVGLGVSPRFQEGFPGGTLRYDVEVSALGFLTDNIGLVPSGPSGWNPTLDTENFYDVPPPESRRTTLNVTIPSYAQFGDEAAITVTATSQNDPTKIREVSRIAIAATRIGPPKADAWVSEQQPKDNFGGQIALWVGSTDTLYMSGLEPHKNMRTWMRFDLNGIPDVIPPGNWTTENLQARLYAFCWGIHGAWGGNVGCYSSDTDDWKEIGITWNNQPDPDNLLDTTRIISNDSWHSWDITSFIQSELTANENLATFCLKAETENLPYPDNFVCEFYPKEELTDNTLLPYIAIGYDVDAWITPIYGEALPGGTISYSVKIMNRGSLTDNYILENIDTLGWGLSVPSKVEDVQPNELRRVDLDVQIPQDASICAENDNVTVTVKSEHYPENVKDSDKCIAHPSEKRIMPAKEDSSTRGGGVTTLENSVWGQGGHESGRGNITAHIENTMYIGRERVFAGPAFLYEAGLERGWLKFDLRGIPSLENLENKRVTLNLFSPPRFLPTVPSVDNGGALVQVYSVGDDSWSEDTITWRNQPSIDNFLDIRNVPAESADGKWYSWDVTDFVRAEYQGDKVASFCLVDLGETLDWYHCVHFDQKELVLENQWSYLEIEQLPNREVRVYMGPVVQNGPSGGSMENYIVTVVNKGTLADTYTLGAVDNLGWTLSLDTTSLYVEDNSENQTILHVTIPPGSEGDLDNIYVTATGTGVSDKAVCFAYQLPLTAKTELKGLGGPDTGIICGGLYHIEVDIDNFLVQQLVVKFYKYNDTFQAENIWWSGGVDVLKMLTAVGQKEVPVENAHLFLRSGGTDRFLSRYTVHQSDLKDRFFEILGEWFPHPELHDCLKDEFKDILGQWFKAPP